MSPHVNKQLPREINSSANRSSIWKTILGVLLITLIINFGACWYLFHYTGNMGYYLIRAKAALLESLQEPVDLLVLGDSSGNQGVNIELLNERLGVDAINLCMFGGLLTIGDIVMLEKYHEQFGPPKSVLIVHGYDMWRRDMHLPAIAQLGGSWWEQVPGLEFSFGQKAEVMVNRYLPLYSQTISLGDLIKKPWRAFPAGWILEPGGFFADTLRSRAHLVEDYERQSQNLDIWGDFEMSQPNRLALTQLFRMAEEIGFDLYLVPSPMLDEFGADPRFIKYYSSIYETLTEIAAGKERVHVLFPQPPPIPGEHLNQVDHTTVEGARLYTERVAEELLPYFQ